MPTKKKLTVIRSIWSGICYLIQKKIDEISKI